MDDRIVHNVPGFWEEVARWAIGIAGTIALLFSGAISWFARTRFENQDKRIDKVESDLKATQEEVASHNSQLSVIVVHIETGKEERQRIENKITEFRKESRASTQAIFTKLDKIISDRAS